MAASNHFRLPQTVLRGIPRIRPILLVSPDSGWQYQIVARREIGRREQHVDHDDAHPGLPTLDQTSRTVRLAVMSAGFGVVGITAGRLLNVESVVFIVASYVGMLLVSFISSHSSDIGDHDRQRSDIYIRLRRHPPAHWISRHDEGKRRRRGQVVDQFFLSHSYAFTRLTSAEIEASLTDILDEEVTAAESVQANPAYHSINKLNDALVRTGLLTASNLPTTTTGANQLEASAEPVNGGDDHVD